MKFAMWVTLALVGVGVFFARDGHADESAAIDGGVVSRRIYQQQQSQHQDNSSSSSSSSEPERRPQHSSMNNNNLIRTGSSSSSSSSFASSEKQQSTRTSGRQALAFEEDDWFNEYLIRSVAMGSLAPTKRPTGSPNVSPTTDAPTDGPSPLPTLRPTKRPTASPTSEPTKSPTTESPTDTPTDDPTRSPTRNPTFNPTTSPTKSPTNAPTGSPVDSLTPNPTDAATLSPTSSPMQDPTRSPTSAPTGTPTSPPTPSPTVTPTTSPSLGPTGIPTVSPSVAPSGIQPTAAPTPVCAVEVEISCVWAVDNATDCRNLPIPGACSAESISLKNQDNGVPLSTISMLFDYRPCDSTLTLQHQPEEFTCEDQGQPSTSTFDAQVTCFDDDMNLLVDGAFSPGQFVMLQGANAAGDLGQDVRCEISEITTGQNGEEILNRLQEMRITTAVRGNFFLQDRYGSLVVESCDAQRCVEPVIYTYTITNMQTETHTITELMRNRSGDLASLLPLLPDGELAPGQSIAVTEEGGSNLCFDATIHTNVMARTTPEEGASCVGSDDYSILVEVECRIDVDITCVTDTGGDCDTMGPPVRTCSENGEGIQALRMRYEGQTCNASSPTNNQGNAATCSDFTMPIDRVQISCTSDSADGVPIETAIESGGVDLGDGETFLLTTNGGNDGASLLPSNVTCEIRSSLDPSVLHQVVSFDTSANLNLQEQFGSLSLEACSTESTRLDCFLTVCLEYVIQNVGTNDVDIVDLTRTLRGVTETISSLLPTATLPSGQTTEAIEKIVVDVCRREEYCVSSVVQSSGSNELVCEDQDELCFGAAIPCNITLDMTCQTTVNGETNDCGAIEAEQRPQCSCSECPNTLSLRYTADLCPDSPTPGIISCIDENPIPEAGAYIVVSSMETVLFEGTVEIGEEISLSVAQDGSCLPEELMVVVSAGETAASSQVATIDSLCSDRDLSPITLLQSFGAFQFSGYTCAEDNVPHFCFVDAEFGMVATNLGEESLTVSSFNFTLNGMETNLLEDIPGDSLVLASQESLTTSASAIIDRCTANEEFFALSLVQGNGGACTAEADVLILIGPIEPDTPSPTIVPTPPPTVVTDSPMPPDPTVEPTPAAPEASPTLSPSQPPAVSPTQAPIETPIAVPTLSPTTPVAVPTLSPTQGSTSDCILDVQTTCTPPPGSDSCEEIRVDPVLCQDRPQSMVFLYDGGNCQNSFNAQTGPLFICRDFNGGPPTNFGASSYVVVTDVRGAGIVYFQGWVGVGELLTVETDSGNLLDANQNITIYGTNETGPEQILQTLIFHSSCSDAPETDSLFLKDRFGAMQVVGFTNEDQGNVSCFVTAGIAATVTVDASISGQPITITSLVSRFSSEPGGDDGLVNFTSEVIGEQLTSDLMSALDVNYDLELNLTTRRTYSVFTTVAGVTADGRECRGSNLFQFAAGQAPPPLFPTVSPTQFPTLSVQPSPDPENTPCLLTAVLTCIVISGGSNTCAGLQNPSDVTCTGEMSPSSLTFQYTGDRCPVNPQNYVCTDTELNTGAPTEVVFVELTEDERIIGFQEVGLNDFIRVEGEYGPSTTVTVYTTVNGMRGETLQTLTIPTTCDPADDLTLLNQYGALQLTGFANAASGEQGIFAEIELIYAVENSGLQLTEVESALLIDAFDGGPIEAVEEPFILEGGAVTILFRNEQPVLNLRLKEQLGRIDTFFLSVRGSSLTNDLTCTDTAQLSF